MRNRILDSMSESVGTCQFIYYRSNGTYCMTDNYTSDWVNGRYSSMTDEGSKKTDEIRTRYLDHHSTQIESFPTHVSNTFPSPACGGGTLPYIVKGRLGPGYSTRGNPWFIDESALSLELLEALRYFESGCAPQETLLANFAWELPEVRSLWPAFRDLFKKRKKGSPLLSREDSKRFSNAYLAYNFGLVPLVGDLITCYERLKSLDDHITWLRKSSGQIVKVEYKASLPKPTASGLPSRPSSAPSGSGGYWRKVTELRSGMKAWALLTYDVSGLTDVQLKTRTLMRSFGLNNPAAILWEAVPYSFVVDWVTNIGDLLAFLEKPIKLPVVFHDCGYGAWTESVYEDYYTTWGKTSLLRRTRTRGYSRRRGIPLSISALSLETPTAKQLSLGLALLAQKF